MGKYCKLIEIVILGVLCVSLIHIVYAGDSVTDTLAEGETKTYTINMLDYEVTNIIVTDSGTIYTQLKINGIMSPNLKANESATMLNGNVSLQILNILPNEAGDVTGDLVEFKLTSFVNVTPTDPNQYCYNLTINSTNINHSLGLCNNVLQRIVTPINITDDNLVFDCNASVIRPVVDDTGVGLFINNRKNITILNCKISYFQQPLIIINSSDINIFGSEFKVLYSSTAVNISDSERINITQSKIIGLDRNIILTNTTNITLENNKFYLIFSNRPGACGFIFENAKNNVIRYNLIEAQNFSVCNSFSDDINMSHNYWYSTNLKSIENSILDYYDNTQFGTVNFCPILDREYNDNPNILQCEDNMTKPEILIATPRNNRRIVDKILLLNVTTRESANCNYTLTGSGCIGNVCFGGGEKTKWLNITGSTEHLQNISLSHRINYNIDVYCNNSSNYIYQKSVGFYTEFPDADNDNFEDEIDCNATNPLINPAAKDIPQNGIDDDCDGIDQPLITGNISKIKSEGLKETIRLFINNSEDIALNFSGKEAIKIQDGNLTIIEFQHNFSRSTLNLTFVINKTNISNKGAMVIKSLELQENIAKTVYFDHLNSALNTICIRDADIESVNDISANCNAAGELSLYCTSSGNSAVFNGSTYTCTDLGTHYKVEGLRHSGVAEYDYTAPPSSNPPASSGGGGGGGGGSYNPQCNDGKDNDGDGLMDYNGNENAAKDPGCESIFDSDETNVCIERWECMPWFTCNKEGRQDRTCRDLNKCGTEKNKPVLVQECKYAAPVWEITKQEPEKENKKQEAPDNPGKIGEIFIKDDVSWLWSGEQWFKEGTEEYKLVLSVINEIENNKTAELNKSNSMTGAAVALAKKANPILGIMLVIIIASAGIFAYLKAGQKRYRKRKSS